MKKDNLDNFDFNSLLNDRVKNMKPSGIRKFFDIVAEMPDALSLGVGEPDFVTPWEIRDGAIKSLQKGYTAYTSNSGLLSLRKEIAFYLNDRFNLSYNPNSEIMVTIGASEAIDVALRALVSSGDEVLVPEPSYVSYAPDICLAGGTPVGVHTSADTKFKLTVSGLKSCITPRTKAIIIPYPNNPTGAIMERAELEAICDVLKQHKIAVISDEIYAELTYGKKHVSIAEIDGMKQRTILINGFSKAFAMTGWRVGYIAAPESILSAMLKVHQYTIMCAPTVSQHAAVSALVTGRQTGYKAVEEMHETYDMRRRFLVDAFNKMGLDCFMPEGAFYVFPSVEKTGLTGDEFAEKLLRSKKIAVVPGSAFGENVKYHIRCSYASSMEVLTEAVARIQQFINELPTA